MNDNVPANVELDTKQNGTVTFAPDVLATIAGLAATEVEGVVSMVGPTGLADILSRKGQSRNLTRGIKIEIENDVLNVDVSIIVDYGVPVPEVAYNIQENIKKAIETMSGRMVSNVDIHVQGMSFEKENKTTLEMEMHQRKLLHKQPGGDKPEEGKPVDTEAADTSDVNGSAQAEEPVEAQSSVDTGDGEDEGECALEMDDVEEEVSTLSPDA